VKSPVASLVKHGLAYWQHGLTAAGRFLLVGALFSGAIGSVALIAPVYLLFCALVSFFLISLLGGHVLKPRVTIAGKLPEKVTAGQTVTAEFTLGRTSWMPAYDVGLRFPELPVHVEEADPGRTVPQLARHQSLRVPVKLQARKRGAYEFPAVQVYTTFPFNVCRNRGAAHPPGSMLVLPKFFPLTGVDVPLGRRYQPGGIALTSDVGESPEYIGTREYRPGDRYRKIDFRTWARLGRPGVKEFQEEYYCRLALVVDTFVAPGRKKGRDGFPELEAAVSLAASVADALSRGEYIVDVFAAGPELYVFRAGRHIAHLENILEILACVEECRSNPFAVIAPAIAGELRNVTSVVCVFLDWDRARAEFVRAAVEAGCAAKVLIVRQGETTEPFAPAEEWAGAISLFTPGDVAAGRIEQV